MIRAIHAQVKGAYGSPRMVRELRQRGYTASKGRVERVMRLHGIRARHKRRYRVTTDSKHLWPVAANLLDRNFAPAAPNQVWTADITYLFSTVRRACSTSPAPRRKSGWAATTCKTARIVPTRCTRR